MLSATYAIVSTVIYVVVQFYPLSLVLPLFLGMVMRGNMIISLKQRKKKILKILTRVKIEPQHIFALKKPLTHVNELDQSGLYSVVAPDSNNQHQYFLLLHILFKLVKKAHKSDAPPTSTLKGFYLPLSLAHAHTEKKN